MTPKRNRRTIEIYFVLYLTVLILLIPSKKDKTIGSDSSLISALLEQNFSIAPEKNVLNCRLVSENGESRIVALDSVNTMFAFGNVTDVHYEFTIEDYSLRQTLHISADKTSPTQIFRSQEDSRQGIAKFFWQPIQHEKQNRNFIVKVLAKAKPKLPESIRDENLKQKLKEIVERDGSQLVARAEFSVNVVFIDGGTVLSQNFQQIDTSQKQQSIVIQSLPIQNFNANGNNELNAGVRNPRIEAYAYQSWENSIRIYGANSKNDIKPTVTIIPPKSGDGSAEIAEIRENEIILKGISPATGAMTVKLLAQRLSDGKEISVEFKVVPQAIPAPIIPRLMFPAIEYKFDPQMPMLAGQDMKAVLYDGANVRFESPQGGVFYFTPKESDIGVKFRLERFVNGKRLGETFQIPVIDFPLPEILSADAQGNKLIVKTRSFGKHGGQDNRIVKILTEGNAKHISERYGDYYTDKETNAHVQTFELEKADETKPFKCTLTAVDSRGWKSKSEIAGE